MMLFQRRTQADYADSLGAYLPGGVLFGSKNIEGSNLRNLLLGMAGELFRANGLLREYSCEILPDKTEKFLTEWESAVGIPDDCFSGTGTIEERRRDILVKLASSGVQTADDFVELASIFGVDVEVQAGSESGVFPLTFPIPFYPNAEQARFTIIVNITVPPESTFPYSFPIPFGTSEIGIIRCIFEKLKPANCELIIRQVA